MSLHLLLLTLIICSVALVVEYLTRRKRERDYLHEMTERLSDLRD